MSICETHTGFPLPIGPGPGQAPAAGEAQRYDAHEPGESRGRRVEHGGWVFLGMGLMGQKGRERGETGRERGETGTFGTFGTFGSFWQF